MPSDFISKCKAVSHGLHKLLKHQVERLHNLPKIMQMRYTNPDRKLLTIVSYYKKLLGLKVNKGLYEFLTDNLKPRIKEHFLPCSKNQRFSTQ